MTTAPAVTVVIPLYNGGAFIGETLDSVAAQTWGDLEVIVVDDGSDDAGPDIVHRHPVGARLLRQSHLGVAVARNRGLLETRGRWVTYLDQDDLWHPTRLERILSWLAQHPTERLVATSEIAFDSADEREALAAADAVVGSWASVHVRPGQSLDAVLDAADVTGSDTVERVDVHRMLRGPVTVTTSFLAEAELLRLAGGFAPHALAMDDYWLLVNASRISPFVKLDQPTVFYRVHMTATSRTTRLALPFLSSAVALRLGGGLISLDEGFSAGGGDLHLHLLDELLRSTQFDDARVRGAARRLAALIWPDGRRSQMARAELRRHLPDSLVLALRRARTR